MTLGEYIKDKAGMAFEWGGNDCATFPADWLILNGRADPMADWRELYDTEIAAELIIKKHGGLAALWDRCLGEPNNSLDDGAVAVANWNNDQLGGIISGGRLVLLREKGIAAIGLDRMTVVASWGIDNG